MMQRHFRTLFALSALACGGEAAGPRHVGLVPGSYVLESVQTMGSKPDGGLFLISASGRVERRVRYDANEYVAIGTYFLDDGQLWFALRENGGQSQFIWRVPVTASGIRFSIRYPDSLDGPDIVETYRRL